MAEYASLAAQIARHQAYPDLEADFVGIDFQRRRVTSSAAFVRAGETVLDVGCNAGYFPRVCPQAAAIHGVDASAPLVAAARALGLLASVTEAPAEALPFPARSFDVVNLSGILDQVYEPAAVVREAARVARRVVVGNVTHEAGTWGRHRIARHEWQARTFSEAELRALLAPCGRLASLGTVDVRTEPQCWIFELDVAGGVDRQEGS